MHEPSLLSLAIPKEYCNCKCKQRIIYGFDIGGKKIEGLLEFFFVCKRFNTVQKSRIHLPKILIFFFHMLLGGSAKPSFSWYKVQSHVDTVTPKAKQYQDVTRLSRDSKLEL